MFLHPPDQPQGRQICLRDRHVRMPQGLHYLVHVPHLVVKLHGEGMAQVVDRVASLQLARRLELLRRIEKASQACGFAAAVPRRPRVPNPRLLNNHE
jgi:hypothetical protein